MEDGLYIPTTGTYSIATPCLSAMQDSKVLYSKYDGYVQIGIGNYRPVVCLKSSIPAKVGAGDYDFELVK